MEQKVSILLVDDNPANLLALEAMLEGLGHPLVRAQSGQEALRLLLHREFAVILLDVEMPGMDGFETATFIRGRKETQHTPIIFLTAAQRSNAEIFRGYAVGAVDYLLKPLVPEILCCKVAGFVELAVKTQTIEVQARELEQRNLELREARTRAEQESRAKSTFLAGMSHELRTPLNAIIGFSDLLTQGVAGPLSEQQREFVGHVATSGRHLLSLVNDILDLSKVEAGRIDLRREWSRLPGIVASVLEVVRPLADEQGVALHVDIPDELPALLIDPVRVKQVLYNLLSNGIKFTAAGGQVTLSLRRHDPWMEIAVSDTGIGIAAHDLPRLFREFEQITPSKGTKPEGTGLGLALTRRLLALHGGTIAVESQVGHGSTFTARLPLEAPVEAPQPPGDVDASAGEAGTGGSPTLRTVRS